MHGLPTHAGSVTAEPFRGAAHTVHKIRQLAVTCQRHLPLRNLAESIVGRLESKDFLSEILAIYYWVLANTRYANDPRNVELVRSPKVTLQRVQQAVDQLSAGGPGQWRPSLDCDDLVCLMAGLFLCLGREVRAVTAAFQHQHVRGQRQYSHVYLQVREPRSGAWIVLDPVAAEGTAQMLSRAKAVKVWPIA